jgi:HEAT repeat protein
MNPEEIVVINVLLGDLESVQRDTLLAQETVAAAEKTARDLGNFAELASFCRAYDSQVRKAAFGALVRIGNGGAVQALIDALGNEDDSCSCLAAESLGRLRANLAVDALIEALTQKNRMSTCRAVAQALGNIGNKKAVPHLIDMLADESGKPQGAAVEALGDLRDPRAVEPLCSLHTHNSELIRAITAEALGKIGDVRAVDTLCTLLTDNSYYARTAAARALMQVADERAIKPLADSLLDRTNGVPILAAGALANIGSRKALPHLKARLRLLNGESDPDYRNAIKAAIQSIEAETGALDGRPRSDALNPADLQFRPRQSINDPTTDMRPVAYTVSTELESGAQVDLQLLDRRLHDGAAPDSDSRPRTMD